MRYLRHLSKRGLWIATAFLLNAGMAQAQVAISTFDSDLGGWTPSVLPDIYWVSNGGNPGGYLRMSDISNPHQFVTAPSKFLGNWSAFESTSTALTFDHKFFAISSGSYQAYDVHIAGPGGSAIWRSYYNSYHTNWWSVRVPIERAEWQLESGDWDALLANVTSLKMSVDTHATNGSSDEEGFDNIRLGPSAETRIDPKGAFLRTHNDPDALDPLIIDLATRGLRGGDTIQIIPVGDYAWTASPPESGSTILGVFSASNAMTGTANLRRVPGAIDLENFYEYTSPPTFDGNLPTDIDEDFAIVGAPVVVTIPAGATHLFLAAVDVYFGDNTDLDDDLGVTISRTSPVSPVGFWKFDQGTAIDSSGFGNNGINFGVTPTYGVINSGMQFNGGSHYIRVPNSSSLNPPYQATINAWFKAAPFSGNAEDPIVQKPISSNSYPYPYYQYNLSIWGNDYGRRVSCNFAPQYDVRSSVNAYLFGEWHMLTAVCKGNSTQLYFDGDLLNVSAVFSGNMPSAATDVYFGRYGYLQPFGPVGVADEIRIYDRALSRGEIRDLYDHPAPARPLSGTVELQDYEGPTDIAVQFEFRTPNDQYPLKIYSAVPDASSSFSTDIFLEGTYDVYVKARHWLRKKVSMLAVGPSGATLNVSLINGDVDCDNEVTLVDFGQLAASFGKALGDAGFDPNADLDGDDEVTLVDLGILSANFGQAGD